MTAPDIDPSVTQSLDLSELLTHVRDHRWRPLHRAPAEPHPIWITLVLLGGMLLSATWVLFIFVLIAHVVL